MSIRPYIQPAVTPTLTLGTVGASANCTTQFTVVNAYGAGFNVISSAAGDAYWYGDVFVEANP